MKKPKPLPIVEVEWVDITSYHSWMDLKDAEAYKPVGIRSVGYLLNRDKKNIRLVMTTSDDMGAAVIKVIPLGCVTKVTRIR